MPIYLCSGSVCRVRSRRWYFTSKITGVQSFTHAELIIAKTSGEARDTFWNEYFHPQLIKLQLRVEGLRIQVREIPAEELHTLLTDALLHPV